MQKPHLRIGSRGSKLAKWQAHYVAQLLDKLGVETSIEFIKTTGDKVQDRFLHEIGGKGLFIKEIESSLMEGRVDFAVHSLKDMPARLFEGFQLSAVLERHSPFDMIIFSESYLKKNKIPPGAITQDVMRSFGKIKIATGSLRRCALLELASLEVKAVPIRGNVDTRLDKLEEEFDALILAEASIERLSIFKENKMRRLDPSWFVPSPAQGALAIETHGEGEAYQITRQLNCVETELMVTIERGILAALGGDCTMPIGCWFHLEGQKLLGDCMILGKNGLNARASISLAFEEDMPLSFYIDRTIEKLLEAGVNEVLKSLSIDSLKRSQ